MTVQKKKHVPCALLPLKKYFNFSSGDLDNPNFSGCTWESFTIHNYGVDGPIKHDQTVYLKRTGCSNEPYLSGKNGKWAETSDHLGSCEMWTLKKDK